MSVIRSINNTFVLSFSDVLISFYISAGSCDNCTNVDRILTYAGGPYLKTTGAPEFGYDFTDNVSLMQQKNSLTSFKQNLKQMICVII